MSNAGIILVAGNSTRFGTGTNKSLEIINGRSVLSYSFRIFLTHPRIDEVLIVCRKEDFETIKDIIQEEEIIKPVKIVLGGKTRQESVYNSLQKTDCDIVLIHDGARPVIKEEFIDLCLNEMKDYKGAIVGVKSKDTIKIVNDKDEIVTSTDRSITWNAQTPQCFDRKLLLSLHEKYKNDFVTDDAMLLEKEGYPVKMVNGDYTNIKITTYDDYLNVKKYLKEK